MKYVMNQQMEFFLLNNYVTVAVLRHQSGNELTWSIRVDDASNSMPH